MSTAAYGFWESPLSPDMLAAGARRYTYPLFDAAGALYFTELRPSEQGRAAIVCLHADGTREDLLPSPFSARSRVHEYGGSSVLVAGPSVYFVNMADQQLYRLARGEPAVPVAVTDAQDTRFAEPLHDPTRARVIAIAEHHAAKREAENFIATIDLANGTVAPLMAGRDFHAALALSPDATQLAFLAWDHPHMPWDAAELWLARLSPAGAVTQLERVAGDAGASALQPTFSPDGTLYFALEADGYWNLHRLAKAGVERVAAMRAELGAPLWQLGTQLWSFVTADEVAGVRFVQGRAQLVRIDVRDGSVELLSERYPYIGQLAVRDRTLVLTTGWAGSGGELVRFELDRGRATVLESAYAGLLDDADTSTPEPIEFATTHGGVAYGFFYAPKNQRYAAPPAPSSLPPLIVVVHGGPTAGTSSTFSPVVQFFTTRGFALLDVNYRGSSGYGRPYRDRLRGQWGVLDVEDCVAGASHLAASGRVDGARMFIRGGSAGGYTVLQALANHHVFAAGSCHYGISDLEALSHDTHKFESHYDRFLIGPYPERRDLYVARSPIHYVERIRRPVVFFQGLDDKVVPADQTERMATTLRAQGIEAEYHGYAGEQHGFRKAETIRHVLETELAFFRRVLAG